MHPPLPHPKQHTKPYFEGEGTKSHFKVQRLSKLNTFDLNLVDPSRLLQNLQDYIHDYFKFTLKILQAHFMTTSYDYYTIFFAEILD